jgi:hypothetical protein
MEPADLMNGFADFTTKTKETMYATILLKNRPYIFIHSMLICHGTLILVRLELA